MLLSAVSVLAVAQLSSEIPEGLMNNPVYYDARPYECQIRISFIKLVMWYMHHIVLGNLLLPTCKIPGLVMVVFAYSDICRCEC